MRGLNRFVTVCFTALFLAVLLPIAVFANVKDTYGDKIVSFDVSEDKNSSETASLYSKDGEYILVFSGEGNVKNFASFSEIPWLEYADGIVSVILEKGVKNLPDLFFHRYPSLRELILYERYVTLIADKQYIPYTLKIYGHVNSTAHLFVFENYPTRFVSICDFSDGVCAECAYACKNHSGGAPTCTEKGKCEICGAEYMPSRGHRLSTLIEEVSPTCYSAGTAAHYVCLDCDVFFDKGKQMTTVEALKLTVDHDFGVLREYTAPSCTDRGFIAHYECSLCLDKFDEKMVRVDDIFISAMGHTGGAATCLSGAVCDRCATVYTDSDLTSHSYSSEFKHNESSHWRECACGATDDLSGHTLTDKVIEEATELEMGITESACNCGYKTSKYIPKLPPKVNGNDENGNPFPVLMVIIIIASLILLGVCITVTVIVIKKIRRNKKI